MTPDERAAARAFAAIHAEVEEAAIAMVAGTLDDPAPMSLIDATTGATLAALQERGWLHIPTTERRTA